MDDVVLAPPDSTEHPKLRHMILSEVATLPLSRDGTSLDMLFVVLTPHWE